MKRAALSVRHYKGKMPLRPRHARWLLVLLFFVTGAYALAENITLTTYYPSPRGVYQQLRATTEVDIGTAPTTAAVGKLVVGGTTFFNPVSGACPAGTVWEDLNVNGVVNVAECRETTLLVNTGAGDLTYGGNRTHSITMTSNPTPASAGNGLIIQAGGPTAFPAPSNRAGGNLNLESGYATGNQGADIQFFTATPGASGSAPRTPSIKMVVKGNGSVGIGTTTPDSNALLQLANGIAFHNAGHKVIGFGYAPGTDRMLVAGYASEMRYDPGQGGLRFGTNSASRAVGAATVLTERMRIDRDGNVGIGTTTPGGALQVVRPASAPGSLMAFRVDGSGVGSNAFIVSPAGGVGIGVNSVPASVHLDVAGGEIAASRTGSVGIGTYTPKSPAPNGASTGNLDANDVYLRGTNRWASEGPPVYVSPIRGPAYAGFDLFNLGKHSFCALLKFTGIRAGGDHENYNCTIAKDTPSAGQWQLQTGGVDDDAGSWCQAICLN